jgi:L-fucose isomerase-like protein
MKKLTFALFFGNREFFPQSFIASARQEINNKVKKLGFETLIMNESSTNYGAVETVEEGKKYAAFLKENSGKYDGVILSLPNFGNENGALAALSDCGVPILIQAYPDEIGKMDVAHRRDAFCGKFSIMDVFNQVKLPFTAFKPHTLHPSSEVFDNHVKLFAAICRIVKKMSRFNVGAIGARTTAFKTVRFDELALQNYGINTETLDMSEVFMRIREVKSNSDKYKKKKKALLEFSNWEGVPEEKLDVHTKVSIILDDIISEYNLDCIALRCWIEIEKEFGISPCVLLGELNHRGIVAACEVDVCNAIAMYALSIAAEKPSMCLDLNNNYGQDENKCILFHCGPIPLSLMESKGKIVDHPLFAKSFNKTGCGWGANVGRIAASPMTFASSKTENGKIYFYLGEGRFTNDPIEEGFFGCGAVAEIENLQDKLLTIGKNGFRHHVSATFGHVALPLRESFNTYLKYLLVEI